MSAASDQELIRNTIASVAIAFDTKSLHKLRDLFTIDCKIDYPGSLGLIDGVDKAISQFQQAIGHIETFHALSTQVITLTGKNTAEASTYCEAAHYHGDKEFHATGRYEDQLEKISAGGVDRWVITKRQALDMAKFKGDLSMFGLEQAQ